MTSTIRYVRSTDGISIGYRELGSGPGLLICHGAGRISQNYEKLAEALAKRYTVYLPDRGRGLSQIEGAYTFDLACDDLLSVLHATNAKYLFGHSAGGLIALEVALRFPMAKLALYEPAVSIDGSIPIGWLPEFEGAIKNNPIKNNHRKKAMAIFLKGVRANDSFEQMPLWLIRIFVGLIAFLERKRERGSRMLDLLPTIIPDTKFAVQTESG